MNTRDLLIAEAVHYSGKWSDIVTAINKREFLPPEEVIKINRKIKSKVLTILDDEYPEYLKHMYQPPLVLFYYGDISLINNPNCNIGIVGTRKPTSKGKMITEEITSDISHRYVVVSGLAAGIDRVAHQSAIKTGGRTIAVLGCGIETCFPTSNEDLYVSIKNSSKHLIVSEYPDLTPPMSEHFPIRNRLIAQFSKGILVTESKRRSGTSITVEYGLLYGREVMCVPSNDYNDSGCNMFLREGATLVENSEHVIEVMG